jgi:ribosomal protein S18 acetylase RimI-like enzyme
LAHWTIRPAGAEDLRAVLALWRVAGVPPGVSDTEAGLRALLASDRGALLLAEAGGELVGSLIATWDGWRGNFYRLAVRPDRRREGIARALVGEGERRLLERGAERLAAVVAPDERGAADFWRAAGYEAQAGRARFIRHPSA